MQELIRSRSPGASGGSARGNRQGFKWCPPSCPGGVVSWCLPRRLGRPGPPGGAVSVGPCLAGVGGPAAAPSPRASGLRGPCPLGLSAAPRLPCRSPGAGRGGSPGGLVVVGVGLRCGTGGGRWRGAGRGAWPVVVRSVARYRSTPGRSPPVRVPRPSRRGGSARVGAWCPCVAGAAGRGSAGSVFHIPRNWRVDSLWSWWYHQVVILYGVGAGGYCAICGRLVVPPGGWRGVLAGGGRCRAERRPPRAGVARSGGNGQVSL